MSKPKMYSANPASGMGSTLADRTTNPLSEAASIMGKSVIGRSARATGRMKVRSMTKQAGFTRPGSFTTITKKK